MERPAAASPPRAQRWRWVAAAAALLVGVLVALRLALPGYVHDKLQQETSAWLGRDVTVARVELSVIDRSLTLHDLRIAAAPADSAAGPQLQVARLYVRGGWRSLLLGAPVVHALELDAPRLRLARVGEGRFDIDDVLARLRAAPAAPAAEPTRFALYNLQLRDGELRLTDRPLGQSHTVSGLQVALPFLSNLPEDVQVTVEPRLAFRYGDTAVDLHGSTYPFSADRRTELALAVDRFDLARLLPYLPTTLPLRPSAGALTAQLTLQFAQAAQTPQAARAAPEFKVRGELELDALVMQAATATPRLNLERLTLPLLDVQPLQRRVHLGDVRVQGLQLALARDRQGRLVGLDGVLATDPAAAAAPQAASAPAPAWDLRAQQFDLSQATVTFSDLALAPVERWSLADLSLRVQTPQWPAPGMVPVQAQARLLRESSEAARLSLSGQAGPAQAALDARVEGVQLAAASAYLRPWLRPRLQGQADAQLRLDWADGEQPRLRIALPEAEVSQLRLLDAAPTRRGVAAPVLAQWPRLVLADAEIDLLQRRVALGRVLWSSPQLALRRDAKGEIDALTWLIAPPDEPRAVSAPAAATAPWRIDLGELLLEGGRVAWRDEAVAPVLALQASDLRLSLQRLSWPAAARPASLSLQGRLVPDGEGAARGSSNTAARLALRGEFGLQPLALRGDLQLERWPLHRFEPYFARLLPVQLARGDVDWRGRVDAALPAAGVRLDLRGSLRLNDLDVRSRADFGPSIGSDDQLLSWNTLQLEPLRVQLAPGTRPRVEIGELSLRDFYSRLVITEQGRFNLRDVQEAPTPAAAATATPAAAPASAPGPALDLVVERTRLAGGRVDFTDRFVKPSYSVALSELAGSIGRFASGTREMAPIELRGRVAGTGQLELRGAVNPTADPLMLDITAQAKDLELAPLSPYSGKYAGYAIERGKLSVDVAYRIDADGRLEARNQIILNQLTFGERVDSPDATKLPVRLAIALLTDRHGVIDVNLPVSGSINDPQFSVWGLVWRIIGNLIAKAVTAPFALLAGGSGPELDVVPFAVGSAQPDAAAQQVLSKVAQALLDRPALQLTIAGHADVAAEKAALQAAVVDARLAAELRRERGREAGPESAGAETAASAEQQKRALRRLYSDTPLPGRPRNLIGLLKDVPPAQMRALLEAAVVVDNDRARELALQRSVAVRDALIARGLASERLFLAAPRLADAAEPQTPWRPRAELSLSSR